LNTSIRLVRCNKMDRLAIYWNGSNALVQHTVLPFVYTLLISFSCVALLVGVTFLTNKQRSDSVSSEENSEPDENEDEDVAVVHVGDAGLHPDRFAVVEVFA
jgi:hypothetical protein